MTADLDVRIVTPHRMTTDARNHPNTAQATAPPIEIERPIMNILLIIVAIIAIILLLTGGFVHALNFLLWVGIILLVLAVIAFLIRSLTGRQRG